MEHEADEIDRTVEAEAIADRLIESCRPHLIGLIVSLLPGERNSAQTTANQVATDADRELAAINAKPIISTAEAARLLGCSDQHVRDLVDRARDGQAAVPIPFQDLDGVLRFPRLELLAWRDRPKPRRTAKHERNKTRLTAVR